MKIKIRRFSSTYVHKIYIRVFMYVHVNIFISK